MITPEVAHFKTKLSRNAQRLFSSNFFQIISETLTNIFISAFIWRFTESFYAVAFYQLGFYIALSGGFYVNGYLLRTFHLRTLFLVGCLLTGIASVAIVFFSQTNSVPTFFIIGCVNAFGYGLYWPNRNYLELQEVADNARDYYFSLINVVGMVARTIIPFVAGWFIVFGTKVNIYSAEVGYWVLFSLAFILMGVVGIIVFKGNYESPKPLRITRFSLQKIFNKRFLLNTAQGVVDGTSFIVPLLILISLGDESLLGVIAGFTALFGAIIIYIYGKKSRNGARKKVLIVSNIIFLLCAISLLALPHPFNILVYVLFGITASNFFYIGAEPIVLAESDKQISVDASLRYSFIFDNEFFLNTGRVGGVLIVILLVYVFSETNMLVYGPIIVALLQVFLLFVFLKKK
ncbi:MFS transporter [Candidatus Pacebacteria bacterium]|nr:MFS transporter [Candidatus Paceibacterota bacterium]